jgi:uncharacterized membrane protein
VNRARFEAFSDGVFAIAITLLVLTIAQPKDYSDLGHELIDRWPAFAAYVVSFAIIGIMWLNHHTINNHLARIDRPLVYLNFFLLLTIVFLPYPTGVFGEALHQGHGTRVAAIVYSATMTVNAVAWSSLWLYASGRRRLLVTDFPESQRHTATLSFTVGTGLYAFSIAVAAINAYACLAFHAGLAGYYALDPLSRRVDTSHEHDA